MRLPRMLLASLLLVACQTDSGPPLAASDIRVFLPLPGSSAAVAYFALENHSRETIRVDTITSPQFVMVEIHETTVTDGIARMQAIGALDLAAKSRVSFDPGGMHLMLLKPLAKLAIGSTVTLEIHYHHVGLPGGLILINARAQSRNPGA